MTPVYVRKAEAWASNHPPHTVAGYHATYYYFSDHLGSSSKTFYRIMWYHTVNGNAINTLEESGVGSSDTTYYPYGKFYTYDRNAARHFTGKEKEGFPESGSYDSGIYYFGGRYYDQSNGIFIQKDPMMQNPSPYLYTNGNPVNRIDPTGLVDETNIPDTYYQEWIKNGGHSAGGTTVGAPQLAQLAGQQGDILTASTISKNISIPVTVIDDGVTLSTSITANSSESALGVVAAASLFAITSTADLVSNQYAMTFSVGVVTDAGYGPGGGGGTFLNVGLSAKDGLTVTLTGQAAVGATRGFSVRGEIEATNANSAFDLNGKGFIIGKAAGSGVVGEVDFVGSTQTSYQGGSFSLGYGSKSKYLSPIATTGFITTTSTIIGFQYKDGKLLFFGPQ